VTEPPSSISVLVDGSKSAEPLTSVGTCFAAHWITCSEALRVAIGSSSGEKRGRSASHPSGSLRSMNNASSSARSAWASR